MRKLVIISVFSFVFAIAFIGTNATQIINRAPVLKNFIAIELAYAGSDCTEQVFKDNCDPVWEYVVCTVDVGGDECRFSYASKKQKQE